MNRYSTYNPNVVWVEKIVYEGDVYHMCFSGERVKLIIQKIAKDKYQVNKRVISDRKVD